MSADGERFSEAVHITPEFQSGSKERKRSSLASISDSCIKRAKELEVDFFEVSLKVQVRTRNLSVDREPFRSSSLDVATVTLLAKAEPGFEMQAEDLFITLRNAGIEEGVWKI